MFEMTRRKQKRVLSANLGYVSLHQDAFHLLLLHKHLPHLLLILAHDTFHLLLLVKHALHCPLWGLWLHRRRLRDLRNLHTLHVEKPLHMKCWQLRADSRLARACEILPECLLTTASRRRPQPWTPLTLSASTCAHASVSDFDFDFSLPPAHLSMIPSAIALLPTTHRHTDKTYHPTSSASLGSSGSQALAAREVPPPTHEFSLDTCQTRYDPIR